jgi:hypothetical protein
MQEEIGAPSGHHLDLTEFDRDVRVERIAGALREALAQRTELSRQAFVRKGELVRIAREQTRALVQATLARRPSARAPELRAVAP